MRHDGSQRGGTLAFGDPVVDRHGGETAPIGLVAELRRTDCRVLYPDSGRGAWAEIADLRRAPETRVAGTIAGRVADLLRLTGAHEMELTRIDPPAWRLVAGHGALRPETVDRVRDLLGEDLIRYSMRPGGMRRIETILEFRFEGG